MVQFKGLGIACLSLWASSLNGADLSQYRGLALGSTLAVVAKAAGMQSSSATVIHRRPVLMQELEWQPRRSYAQDYATEPVKEVVLSFLDGQLYRMAANYDRFRTEGMTAEDLVAAISQVYGTPTRPVAEKLWAGSPAYPESVEVIARWEDAQYSCNLVHAAASPEFSMILFSKRLDEQAQKAGIEAVTLDKQEAPEREAALRKAQEQEQQVVLDKARLANKQAFRP
jgi:hypothetical protein